MATPSGCRSRISSVSSTVLAALTACCAATSGCDRSTSVLLSMSMFRKPALIASRVRSFRPAISASGSSRHLVALNWKWSPCRKTGPCQSDRRAAARITAVYSAGRWSVYAISDLAISNTTAPASRFDGGGKGLSGGQVRRCADVDGRGSEIGGVELAAPARQVQLVDAGRWAAERLAGRPDHPAAGIPRCFIAVEDGLEGQLVHQLATERGRIRHLQAIAVDAGRRAQAGEQQVGGLDGHPAMLAEGRDEGE